MVSTYFISRSFIRSFVGTNDYILICLLLLLLVVAIEAGGWTQVAQQAQRPHRVPRGDVRQVVACELFSFLDVSNRP